MSRPQRAVLAAVAALVLVPAPAAAADGGGGGATPWLIAAVLGVAGCALTIAGLSAARRERKERERPRERRRQREARAAPAPVEAERAPEPAAPTAPPPAPADIPVWEECHVVLAIDEDDDRHFNAEHAGEAEPIARSPVFRARRAGSVMESAAARDALQVLVTSLLAAGWQVVGRDDDPWALRLRRRVSAGRPVEHSAGR